MRDLHFYIDSLTFSAHTISVLFACTSGQPSLMLSFLFSSLPLSTYGLVLSNPNEYGCDYRKVQDLIPHDH